jgi:hypothetical protein
MDPAAPRRWVLIAREIGIPDRPEGHDRWSLDHLFVDQDAVPALVEVKRSSDTRIRRQVVGQMLDYAANGLQYWPVDDIRAAFEATHADESDTVLRELLGDDADLDRFWSEVENNLEAGRVRLIFVADVIPAELQTIVEFLNERMVDMDVLAVEIKQYVGEGTQTLVPRVIGLTGKAKRKHGRSATYDELLADASDEVRDVSARLFALAEADERLDTQRTKYAVRIAAAGGVHDLVMLYPTKSVQFNLRRISDAGLTNEATELHGLFSELDERTAGDRLPLVRWELMRKHWSRFVDDVWPMYVDTHLNVLAQRPAEDR